jgi:hypothetical protein
MTVLPQLAAYTVEDLIPDDLEGVVDPVLRLPLRIWKGRQKVRVFGDDLNAYLDLRLPLAFDASGKLGTAILGQHFFHAVRVLLDHDAGNEATIL